MPNMDPSKDDKTLVETTSPVDQAGKLNSATARPGYGVHEPTTIVAESAQDGIEESGGGWFAYLKTRNFYLVLALGYLELPQASALTAVR